MKTPMRFYSTGDCGCGSSSQTGNATPCFPVEGALVCDNRYYSLINAPALKVLGVPLGSNCQAFLNSDFQGFLFYGANGVVSVTKTPTLELPYFNPKVEGNFPAPGGWPYLMVATSLFAWDFIGAPTTGDYQLVVKNGLFQLVSAGSSPVAQSVCSQVDSAPLLKLVGCVQTGVDGDSNPVFGLKKLTVSDKRVIVGFVDGDTGETGFKTLPIGDFLEHPKAKLNEFQCTTYEQLDDDDDPISGGIAVQSTSGGGAVTDAVLAVYSPSAKKFFRVPARVKEVIQSSNDVAVADNGSYQVIAPHCLVTVAMVNHPDVFISASIRVRMTLAAGHESDTPNYNMDFGLFVDGALVFTWDLKGTKDNTVTRLHKGLSVGVSHTFEIRVKKDAVAFQSLVIDESNMDVFTVL